MSKKKLGLVFIFFALMYTLVVLFAGCSKTVDSLEFPVMTIDTEGGQEITSKEEYLKCFVTVDNAEEEYCFLENSAKIRGRGNSTWDLDKKPYKLKFDEKIDLFGNGKAKTWTLLANACDPSMIRNYLAYSIGSKFDGIGETTTTTQFVELTLNGEYRGLYLICEQTEVGKTRVNISDSLDSVDTGYLLEMDSRADGEGTVGHDYFYIDGLSVPYALKSPDVEDIEDEGLEVSDYISFINSYMQSCYDALSGSDYTKITSLIDVNTFAESYIVHELFKAVDVGQSSFFVYKEAGGKLYSGPIWDFDLSSGDCWYENPRTKKMFAAQKNPWYEGLLKYDEFRQLVAQKLTYYEDTILKTIDECVEYVYGYEQSFLNNYKIWRKNSVYTPFFLRFKTTWKSHVKYVNKWLKKSLKYLIKNYCE